MDFGEEIKKLNKLQHENADRDFESILVAYKRTLNEIHKEIGLLYVKNAKDGVLNISSRHKMYLLSNLTREMSRYLFELNDQEEKAVYELLKNIYTDSYLKTGYLFENSVGIELNFSLLNHSLVKTAVLMPLKGERFSDRIWKNKELLLNRLRNEIEAGIIKGETIDQMAKRIKKTFEVSAYEASRLMRTELARCMTSAQVEVYKASGLVKKVMFDATLDDKTSDVCQSFDGKYFDLGEEPKIPEDTHPNCRSCIIPVIEGWEPSRKRENMKSETGEKLVIDYKNYEAWKETIKWNQN